MKCGSLVDKAMEVEGRKKAGKVAFQPASAIQHKLLLGTFCTSEIYRIYTVVFSIHMCATVWCALIMYINVKSWLI